MSSPRGRLIIVCGLPGSGKTTYAVSVTGRMGGTRFSPDEWMDALALDLWDEDRRARIERLQWQVARDLLALGATAIIEWGTWRRSERDILRLGARALGASVERIHLSAEPEVLFERIDRRGRENPPITLDMLREWTGAFEVPTAEELALYDSSAEATISD